MELTKKNSEGSGDPNVVNTTTDSASCGTDLPAPPSAPCAQLNLVKQLNLFLELEALMMNGDVNEAAKLELENSINEADTENSEELSFSEILDELNELDIVDDSFKANDTGQTLDESLVFIEGSMKRLSTDHKLTEVNGSPVEGQTDFTVESGTFAVTMADIEDGEFGAANCMDSHGEHLNKFISTLRTEKLKPLIPSYFYDETSNPQYFSSGFEPMIGREWVFKEIEKVSHDENREAIS